MPLFRNLFSKKVNIVPDGALPDDRKKSEKEKDYVIDEVIAASLPAFQNEKPTSLVATQYSQEYTSSCVPHGFDTQLEYEGIVTQGLSQLRAYRKRSNYPSPGSNAVDMYDKIKAGQHINQSAPVLPGHTEVMANALLYQEGTQIIEDFNYFQFTDFSKIPSEVAQGKAISIFIYATLEEWSQEYVTIRTQNLDPAVAYIRHCVCLMPKGDFTENGQFWLAVHDSAKFGGRHLRYISQNFLMNRCYFAAEVRRKDVIVVPPPPAPSKPYTECKFGDRGKAVSDLQAYLINNGYLESQYHTSYYGRLTCKAVLWFQLYHHRKFKDVDIPQLLKWEGKYWGRGSIDVVKSL